MDIQDMRIFARVAVLQNLSAVGTEMALTPGTISKRIQALEDDLGAKLFDRNTRSIRITEEGTKLLEYVERILVEVEGARAAVSANVDRPRGRLRVCAPPSLGSYCVAPAVCAFMEQHKDIEIQIEFTDRPVNLQEGGYDVVIRSGTLPNTGLIRKPLSPDPHIVVASPGYLEKHGTPATPEELARHSCLVLGESTQWDFVRKGQKLGVRVSGRLRSDTHEMLLYAAAAGLGIARVSRHRAANKLQQGYLTRILSSYEVEADSGLCAFYPSTKHVLPKLRVFLDFLGEWFRDARNATGSAGDKRKTPKSSAKPLVNDEDRAASTSG